MTVKVNRDSAPPVHVDPKVVEEAEPKVVEDTEPWSKVEESESKVEESLIETPKGLPVEPIMELVPSLIAISLRSPDVYNPL